MIQRFILIIRLLTFALFFYLPVLKANDSLSLIRSYWGVEMNYFFDNDEFDRSTLAIPQTMTGVHLIPTVGYKFDESLSLSGGLDFLSLAGSTKTIDKLDFLAWFTYTQRNSDLYVGSFTKNRLLSNYNELFFNDSSLYFRNKIKGLYWNLHQDANFFNLWLDWTGMQTDLNRETFFIGSSASVQYRGFFLAYQSYMFHFANAGIRTATKFLHDNALFQLDLGWKGNVTDKYKMVVSTGPFYGYERKRDGHSEPINTLSLTANLHLYSENLGWNNLINLGGSKNKYYDAYAGELYWNTPFVRSNYYVKSELYYKLVKHKHLNGKIFLVLRWSQAEVLFEQKLLFDLIL